MAVFWLLALRLNRNNPTPDNKFILANPNIITYMPTCELDGRLLQLLLAGGMPLFSGNYTVT